MSGLIERPSVLRVNDRVVFSGTTHTVVAISGATSGSARSAAKR
jgi:hypothetical protein